MDTTINQIIQALIFLIPGFMAVEVANAMTSRQSYRRSDKERLSAWILFSFFSWLIFFSIGFVWRGWRGVYPNNFFSPIQSYSVPPESFLWTLLWVLTISILLGLFWGLLVRNKWLDHFYYLLRKYKLSSYEGPETVWDISFRAMQGRWVEIHMKDGRVFVGAVTHRSHEPQATALFIQKCRMWFEKYDEKGELIKGKDTLLMENYNGIYIDISEADSVFFFNTTQEKNEIKQAVAVNSN